MQDALYFGDNLDVLREHIRDETIDLVYLDPPFNSNADYNVLFKSKKGTSSQSQIRAFTDTWHWGDEAQRAFDEVRRSRRDAAAAILESLHRALGTSDMMAYLAMMGLRLIELRRTLAPTGSLYLHCDPTASHYLRILLDAVFSPQNFRSEVIWKRSSAHNSAKRFGPVHDTILFYTNSASYVWNPVYQPLPQETADAWYNNIEKGTGRRFNRADLTAPGVRVGPSGKAWGTIDPSAKGRHWAIPGFLALGEMDTLEALELLDSSGRLHWPARPGGMPMLKRYLDESKGIPAQDVITDVAPLNNVSAERLGYPTQKPLGLLARFLLASSNEGDVVLDPFCGCGTTIEAAHRLGRNWIGIDISYDAIRIIEQRLQDRLQVTGTRVIGAPESAEDAAELARRDPYQLQVWATYLAGGVPKDGGKKGADRGVDGYIRYTGPRPGTAIVSVKGGERLSPSMVRDLAGVVGATGAQFGAFISLAPPTREMEVAAAAAGTVALGSRSLPRVQIRTIADLLAGRRFDLPAMPDVFVPAPAAEREARRRGRARRPDPDAPELLLPIPGDQAGAPEALPARLPRARRRPPAAGEPATTVGRRHGVER